MTTTETSQGQVTWTQTGQQLFDRERATREGHAYAASRDVVVTAMQQLTWREVGPVLTLPMSLGEGINLLVRELRLPKVSKVAWDGAVDVYDEAEGSASLYELYGIEANYTNGRVRVFVVDRGVDLLVMATEFHPAAAVPQS